ncbi:His Kinase A (phospho-acceptor) domain-containing protein [Roseivivax lentus]|uniref:histidine kinase n=1 Tax=Roseivivax lentus TaxID=633194 RepID=A0A1N7NQH8_9RHOB|nr:ATP-binding protein [Roseivivax lentus]SIT00489.1 His Kinase A (phospho-acceptor) domain-containing protein [Roseivivax lentus]
MTDRTSHARDRALLAPVGIAGWLLACGLAVAAIGFGEREARIAMLTAESARLHALASQRAGQHDAHLTALSAIAVAGVGGGATPPPDAFLDVAGAIMTFYPRITGIALVPLDGRKDVRALGDWADGLDDLVRDASRRSTGAPVLISHPAPRPAYIMVKRSPNSEAARYGLALVIDAAALLDADTAYWTDSGTARHLALPDGTPLLTEGGRAATPQFARALSSSTQPLRLETSVRFGPADLLPPGRVAAALIVITLLAVALRAAIRQRAHMRAAERRAELSGLETRLAHASRVNALGEMASGMAHELTQPLTAILAQAQAARHLARRGDTDRLAVALDDVVDQTRRASGILERLRTWTRPQQRRPEEVDLRDCVRVAQTLLADQAAAVGARLTQRLPATGVAVLADRVELEQVLFNLIKNALDAVAGVAGPREVTISLTIQASMAQLDVGDTGHGIPEDIRHRLFTPFLTTREDGTGLGLVLSQRLIERAGGDLVAVDVARGALFRITLPLAGAARMAAQ